MSSTNFSPSDNGFDAQRNPLQEMANQSFVSRRRFLTRAALIGIATPTAAALLQACASDDSNDAATSPETATQTDQAASSTATSGGDLRIAVQFGDANAGLDPLHILDAGSIGVVSQSFEYLVGIGRDGTDPTGPTGLATNWESNADATEWTFTLREDAKWHDGTPLQVADVAATIDRMVEAGAGLSGVLSAGAVTDLGGNKALFKLDAANGNFPILLSPYNPQSLITPADYVAGTTLNERNEGTGAWKLDSFDATTFTAKFVPNENWWGDAVKLDSITLVGFEDSGTAIAAMQAGEIDMVQLFNVVEGQSLLNDPQTTVLRPPSAAHRQIWFNTQEGQFQDPRVREAVALGIDRQQIVDVVYRGNARIGNDHPVMDQFTMFNAEATPQRSRDIEAAKALLAEAGFGDGMEATLQVGNVQDVPDLAAIVQQNLADIGINLTVNVSDNSDFYGEYWCPGASWGTKPDTSAPTKPCGSSAEIGIVDYGHRPTPDIFFARALQTDGDWNASNYSSEAFDALLVEYQKATDPAEQKRVTGEIQKQLHQDTPAVYPVFFDFLAGHNAAIAGVEVSALGHMYFDKATLSE